MPTTIIHRHWFGATWRGLLGLATVALLLFFQYHDPERIGQVFYAALIVLVSLVTVVVLIVYARASIAWGASGILVTNYPTLFWRKVVEVDWNAAPKTEFEQPGIFAGFFHYGTLGIRTADGSTNLSMTYVPDVGAVREALDERAHQGATAGGVGGA